MHMDVLGSLRRLRSDDRGFTLMEVVGASAILFTVVVSTMGSIQFAAVSARQNSMRDGALNLASQQVEEARNLPYDDLGTISPEGDYGDPPGPIVSPKTVDEYTVVTTMGWVRDPNTGRSMYKNVRVRVSWTLPRPGNVTLETAIFGKSAVTNSGDVLVQVLDADSGDPVPGVTTVIDPSSGSNRTLQTDESGEAFFGYVPAGAVAVALTKTGYLIDTYGLGGATVQADTLTRLTAYAQLPSTGIVNVTGSSGQPLAGATVQLTDSRNRVLTATTGADGHATFTDLLKDTYSILATLAGRTDGTGVIQISAGNQSVTEDIVLADPAQLTVNVTQEDNGAPVQNATVRLQGPAPSTADANGSPAVTTSAGEASFHVYHAGSYTLTVSKAGFTTVTQTVDLDSGAETEDVELQPIQAGSLLVRVVRSNGNPRVGRAVTVRNTALGYSGTFYTDGNGYVLVTGLVPAVYQVTSGSSYNVTISAGQQTFLQITS